MTTISTINILNTASFISINASNYPTTLKVLMLSTINTDTLGRTIYLKDITGSNVTNRFCILSTSSLDFIQNENNQIVSSLQCLQVQAFSTTQWSILNKYNGINTFSTGQSVFPLTSTSLLSLSTSNSQVLVDLRTASKTLILPSIPSFSTSNTDSFFLTIKDFYGNAQQSTLFLSTSVGDTIDGFTPAIRIQKNFASIDLASDLPNRRWHILNYYSGNLL
jgi:hypothetical protein